MLPVPMPQSMGTDADGARSNQGDGRRRQCWHTALENGRVKHGRKKGRRLCTTMRKKETKRETFVHDDAQERETKRERPLCTMMRKSKSRMKKMSCPILYTDPAAPTRALPRSLEGGPILFMSAELSAGPGTATRAELLPPPVAAPPRKKRENQEGRPRAPGAQMEDAAAEERAEGRLPLAPAVAPAAGAGASHCMCGGCTLALM